MKKIRISYRLMLLGFFCLISTVTLWLIGNAYNQTATARNLSDKIKNLLEYVSVKQLDKNNAQDLSQFLAGQQNSSTSLPAVTNPFKIFRPEETTPEVMISPTSSLPTGN